MANNQSLMLVPSFNSDNLYFFNHMTFSLLKDITTYDYCTRNHEHFSKYEWDAIVLTHSDDFVKQLSYKDDYPLHSQFIYNNVSLTISITQKNLNLIKKLFITEACFKVDTSILNSKRPTWLNPQELKIYYFIVKNTLFSYLNQKYGIEIPSERKTSCKTFNEFLEKKSKFLLETTQDSFIDMLNKETKAKIYDRNRLY